MFFAPDRLVDKWWAEVGADIVDLLVECLRRPFGIWHGERGDSILYGEFYFNFAAVVVDELLPRSRIRAGRVEHAARVEEITTGGYAELADQFSIRTIFLHWQDQHLGGGVEAHGEAELCRPHHRVPPLAGIQEPVHH